MSYRYDKQQKNKRLQYLLGLVLLVIIFFTPFSQWVFYLLEKPFVATWENRSTLEEKSSSLFASIFLRQKIVEENRLLKEQLAEQEINRLRTQYLEQQLAYYTRSLDKATHASIIHKGPFGLRDMFIIRFDTEEEIPHPGDYVIGSHNLLLGEITDVYQTTARVRLYSTPSQSVQGVLYPHAVSVTAQGYGNGSFVIDAPREIEVVEGDVLYSQELPGNVIAVVRAIEFDPRDPFKKVYLSYPINIQQIQSVQILKNAFSEIE